MSTQAKPKILLVDDEQRVIESLAQLLRRDFDVRTASLPQEALKSLDEIHGLAVVVSDFRMPGMDGATLLHQFMVRRPDVSRILLTGESGREGAIRAINEGQILRFLTKPCPIEELKAALDAGVIQHRLVRAERSVLQETLIGCIKALMEVLSIANPVAFGRAERIRKAAIQCAERLNCTDFWQLEAAAMLSQLGYITVPETALEKMYAGQPLTPDERRKVDDVPDVANALLEHIPRLEPVIQIVAALKWSDAQIAKLGNGTIGTGARILGAIIEYEALVATGKSRDEIFAELHRKSSRYGEKLVMQLDDCIGQRERAPAGRSPAEQELLLRDVMPGARLQTELRAANGNLLVPLNFEVTKTLLDRLANIHPELLATRVRVSAPTPG